MMVHIMSIVEITHALILLYTFIFRVLRIPALSSSSKDYSQSAPDRQVQGSIDTTRNAPELLSFLNLKGRQRNSRLSKESKL